MFLFNQIELRGKLFREFRTTSPYTAEELDASMDARNPAQKPCGKPVLFNRPGLGYRINPLHRTFSGFGDFWNAASTEHDKANENKKAGLPTTDEDFLFFKKSDLAFFKAHVITYSKPFWSQEDVDVGLPHRQEL